ncbi:MAG TPA: rod shape-determining protein MreC, partial [Bacilli bacterium]
KRRLLQYARDTARLNALEMQNKQLQKALGFTERQQQQNHYIWHAAYAVAISPDPLYNTTIKINLGSKDGIREDMAVVSPDGLIGRIERVTPYYATVQLISDIIYKDVDYKMDTSKGISATIKGKDDVFGMIESFDNELGFLVMNKIPDEQSKEIATGDTVITSGLGELFPAGIVIGQVVSKKEGDFGITYKAYVKPAATYKPGTVLFVIENPQQ